MKVDRKEGLTGVKVEHNRTLFWIIIALLVVLIAMLIYIKMHPSEKTENAQIANPASVYCIERGGQLKIETAQDGSQSGICTLKNGTECEEWKYYRGEC